MSDKSRRKLLKSIAAGSGAIVTGKNLPDSWSRPLVDAVLLPAHAMTSIGATGGSSGNIAITSIENLNNDSMFARISDKFIHTAQAQLTSFFRWTVCVTPPITEGGKYTIQVMHLQEAFVAEALNARITFATVLSVELAVGESMDFPKDTIAMSCVESLFREDMSVKFDTYSNGVGTVTIAIAIATYLSQTVAFGPGGCALDNPDCSL